MKIKTLNMRKTLLAAVLTACSCVTAMAQESETAKGKAIVQVFGNYNAHFNSSQYIHGFELERSYLGYEQRLGNGLTVKGVMDIGKPSTIDDYHRMAYIKNAMISWKKGNLTLNGGLISTTQFNFQEKFWGHRYIMKSFQDQYKFGSSADLGLSAAYRLTDWLSADAIVVNGEGYKKIQQNNGLNYGLGLTLAPVDGLQIRLYGGLNEGSGTDQSNTANLAAFAGYKGDRFSIGAEYNYMQNASFTKGNNLNGYSLYASMQLTQHTNIYARFDELSSENAWNIDNDESAAIIGMQFKLGNHVKIAPNFRIGMPKNGDPSNYAAYISCYFGI